jgi:hypothetical protein
MSGYISNSEVVKMLKMVFYQLYYNANEIDDVIDELVYVKDSTQLNKYIMHNLSDMLSIIDKQYDVVEY